MNALRGAWRHIRNGLVNVAQDRPWTLAVAVVAAVAMAGGTAYVASSPAALDQCAQVREDVAHDQAVLDAAASRPNLSTRQRQEIADRRSVNQLALAACAPGPSPSTATPGSSAPASPTPGPTATTAGPSSPPSTTPPATPSAAPSVSPTPTPTGPPSPTWPDASNTGWAPTGVTLRPYTGSLTLGTPGVTLDGYDFPGSLCIKADDIVITRSRVRGSVETDSGGPFGGCNADPAHPNRVAGIVLRDVEIVGPGTAASNDWDSGGGFALSPKPMPACQPGQTSGCTTKRGFECDRCRVHGWGSGFYLDQNALIQNSYVHELVGFHKPGSPDCGKTGDPNACIAHRSGLGGNGWQDSLAIHNTVDGRPLNGIGGMSGQIVVYSQPGQTHTERVTVQNNLFLSGDSSACLYAGTGGDPPVALLVRGNRFGRLSNGQCGVNASIFAPSTGGVTFDDNRFVDNGAVVPVSTLDL